MRIAFTTLGCKINQFETDQLRQELLGRGNTIVPFESEADVYIINTCSVTAKSDYQCRQVIRSAAKRKGRVIVTGCYASTRPDEIKAIDCVELVIPNTDKASIPDLLATESASQNAACCSKPTLVFSKKAQAPELKGPAAVLERTRAFLKIQDGCNNCCTYCIVPKARGKSRSADVDEVVRKFDSLVGENHPEIVLTGIHIGGYGADLIPQTDLSALLGLLLSRRGKSRLRLSSIEANEITDEIISHLDRGLCRHFHIPLQSGDDSLLSSMKRQYTSGFYRDLLMKIATRVPGTALGADIIVGFPGEGEKEFKNTVDLVQNSPLSHFHVFSYSVRPGTPAALMKDQVPEPVKKERSEILRDLGREKNLAFTKQFLEKELSVVVEDKKDTKSGLLSGLSDNYIRVGLKGAKKEDIGRQVRVILKVASMQGNIGYVL